MSQIPPDLPSWTAYVAVAVLAVGLLVLLLAVVPPARPRLTAADRIEKYIGSASAHRTDPSQGGSATAESHLLDDAKNAAGRTAGRFLRRNADLEARITARLEAAGSPLRAAEWLPLHVGAVVAGGLLGLLLGGGDLLVGLLFVAAGAVGPWLWLSLKRRKRQKRFNAALPDTLQLLAGSIAAGLSLTQGVDTVVREGQEPVATEFRRVLVENRLGVSLEDALDDVATRMESKDFGWAVMAIRIQRQVGGNLAELLQTVSGTMREREYLRRQVGALAAEGKMSAYVLGGLPPLFFVFMLLTRRDYIAPLFTDPRGIAMLVVGALMLVGGAFWMKKLVKVEI